MADTYNVDASSAKFQFAAPSAPTRVTNQGGGTLYYKTDNTVSSSVNDGNLTAGQAKTFRAPQYLIASTGVNVLAVQYSSQQTNALDTRTRFANFEPVATTSGTDTTGIATVTWITSLDVPQTTTVTGIQYLIGSVGGTDKAIAILFDADGAVLANSATAGVTVGTTATFQSLSFTSALTVFGPARYFVGLQTNGTTAKIRTVPISARLFSGQQTGGTFGTIVALTPPTTFTADQAPIVATF